MHEHNHSHNTANSPEETLALLNYMLGHNRSHAEELQIPLLYEAVEDFNRGSEKLAGVLAMMKGV